ncbi:MAG: hypothetical protein QOG11_1527 [Solirubrobacteraceae bacterium]|jgi:hypothetical protein|nr:hypothetical protein [Solirubrobacteraceae bacterium]
MPRDKRWRTAVLVLPALALASCARSSTFDDTPAADAGPARVEAVTGSDAPRVVLSGQAARRLGIRTTAIVTEQRGGRKREVVPFSAVLYDAHGRAFTYTSPKHLVFVRRPIRVASITGGVATLRAGPPAGTMVVTVGAPELLGTEYGVEE